MRGFLFSLFVAASAGSLGCYAITPYRPNLDPKTAATFVPIQMQEHDPGGHLLVDVYTFDKGCPEVDTRLRASGYQGSVPLSTGEPFTVAGDEPVALQFGWSDSQRYCRSLLVVRPMPGLTYGYLYTAPESGTPGCASAIARIIENPNQKPELKKIEPVNHVPQKLKAPTGSGQAIGSEEAMSSVEATATEESTGPSLNSRLCSLADIPAAVDAPENTSPEKTAAASAPVLGAPPAVPQPSTGDSTASAPPPSPAPPVPATTPAPATPIPVASSRPRAPIKPQRASGSGVFLGFGVTGGGKDLASAQNGNGDRIAVSAGGGASAHIGFRLTPVWFRDRIGLGGGADVGVRGQSIDASDGSASLLRFPFVVAAHLLIQGDRHWFFLLRGGVHKDLSAHLSGTGVASVDVNFNTHVGGLGEIGALYAVTPNVGFDFMFRVTVAHYDFARQRIDATNAGVFSGIHLMF